MSDLSNRELVEAMVAALATYDSFAGEYGQRLAEARKLLTKIDFRIHPDLEFEARSMGVGSVDELLFPLDYAVTKKGLVEKLAKVDLTDVERELFYPLIK